MEDRLWTTAEVGGTEYSIKKMTALTGAKVARRLLSALTRIDLGAVESASADELIKSLGGALDSMDDEATEWLISTCLRHCFKALPAGPCPVINANGSFGVPEVEYDLALTLQLVFESLKWNVAGFFDESASTSDAGATFRDISQFVQSRLTSTLSPPS